MISNSTSGIVVLAFGSYEESNLAWTPRTVDSSLGMADLSSGTSAWKKVRFIAIRHLRIPDRPIVLPSRTYVSKEAALPRDVLPEEDEPKAFFHARKPCRDHVTPKEATAQNVVMFLWSIAVVYHGTKISYVYIDTFIPS